MLPIVQRELQTAARDPRLYRRRTLTGLIVVAVVVLAVINPTDPRRMRGVGTFFETFSLLAFFLCLLEGVRKTSDSIGIERREGTLGLLFLSTLSGFDIVLGKLASATIRSFSTLLAFIPILAISLLVGGTTAGEFWRTILVLILGLTLSLSLCLCVSTITREGSLVLCVFLLVALSIAPFIGFLAGYEGTRWIVPLSPLYTLRSSFDAFYSTDSHRYWLGVSYLGALSLMSVALDSIILPRSWQDRPFKSQPNQRLAAVSPQLAARRRAMLDRNPIMWLMFDARSHRQFRWFLLAVAAVVILATGVTLYITNGLTSRGTFEMVPIGLGLAAIVLGSSLRVARSTTRHFFEARSNGALELLLSTPMKVSDILAGNWMAIRADLAPAIVLFSALSAVLLFLPIVMGEPVSAVWVTKAIAESILGVVTIRAVAIWMALRSRTATRAFVSTAGIALVGPHIILCVPTLLIQVILLIVALDKVKFHFRRFVAEQYLPSANLAPPLIVQANVPPVVRHSTGSTS